MEFIGPSLPAPARLGILAGSFNPPTIAHRELVYAAGFHVDQVLCVLPRVFPHKEYFGATIEERIDMVAGSDFVESFAIAICERGLFVDIAAECRDHYGPSTKLHFVCGTDAAERILNWDYGRPGVVEEMLERFNLLVAPRGKVFEPPPQYRDRILPLHVGNNFHDVSSTEVRDRIRLGQDWEHLVPKAIVEKVRLIYS